MSWCEQLRQSLPELGQRNWILVTDAAYPEMTAPGIVTLTTGQKLIPVLIQVVDLLKQSSHVTPDVVLDQEWFELTEQECPGIDRLKMEAEPLFSGLKVEGIWHEDLLKVLAEASQTYTVFVIKTTSTIPYTSVFLRLECGYWSENQEKAFRARLNKRQS